MYFYRTEWFGPGAKAEFLDDVFRQLHHWTDEVVEKFGEFPAGYTEWTMTGHLALAASRSGYYPLQDYTIRNSGRPDLYIRRPDWKHECIIEVKPDGIALERGMPVTDKIAKRLSESWQQAISRPEEESQYRCGLLGVNVWAHTRKWDRTCTTRWQYGYTRNRLWRLFKDGVENARWDFDGHHYRPNFCCGYFLLYDQALGANKEAKSDGSEVSNSKGVPFAVGQLWTGIVKHV